MKSAVERRRGRRSLGCAIATLIVFTGCSKESVATFAVKAKGLADTGVELELCGRITRMTRQGDAFVTSGRVTCEGEARVRLSLADGGALTCKAGYVTPGLHAGTYEVTAEGQECSVRMIPPG